MKYWFYTGAITNGGLIFSCKSISAAKYDRCVGATNGEERDRYLGELIIKLTDMLASQIILKLTTRLSLTYTVVPVKKILGIIELYNLVFDDGRCGFYHSRLQELYLWLALYSWRVGDKDRAFAALDEALEHTKKLDVLRTARRSSLGRVAEKAQ